MPSDLRASLNHEPRELGFGTSGRRGPVVDLTQLEVYINVTGELEFLQRLPRADGGIVRGGEFCFAHDLRPSSTAFDDAERGRGELCQAAERALRDAGMQPVYLGAIPTPALMYYATARGIGSIMITGSHIPFDLNGYKLNTSIGEILKEHEAPIGAMVRRVRERIYSQPAGDAMFDENGMFRWGHTELPVVSNAARNGYIERYQRFFQGSSLNGRRILVYQHSAVGRDLLAELLESLGAHVTTCGRSDTFVAVDTEAIDDSQLAAIQGLADQAGGGFWAVVSTDGDSDRPLILGCEFSTVKFYPGDLAGIISAEYLGADAVVVPISCNDAIDCGPLARVLQGKTRIGSPHVIAGMQGARAEGCRAVCGWEPNGGFLVGSDITRQGRTLSALPTRDAVLPILCVLFSALEKGLSLPELFAKLPPRFSRAALVRNFARSNGRLIVGLLTAHGPEDEARICRYLESFFTSADGFGPISRIDYTDGVRIIFTNGEVAHLRPSGNADEFRIYAVADTQRRADGMIAAGVAEPAGIVRLLERALIQPAL